MGRIVRRNVRRGWRGVAATLLALALATGVLGGLAYANGEPVEIELRYLDGVSNFGARDATGRVRIVMVEGDVRLTASKLPRQPGARYEGWIINTKTNERLSVGKFDPGPDGTVNFTTVLEALGEREFDLFIVTVEPEPDPSPAPDARVALAGRRVPSGPPQPVTAVPREGASGGTVPVVGLPRTGVPALDPALPGGLGVALVLVGGLGALVARSRRQR